MCYGMALLLESLGSYNMKRKNKTDLLYSKFKLKKNFSRDSTMTKVEPIFTLALKKAVKGNRGSDNLSHQEDNTDSTMHSISDDSSQLNEERGHTLPEKEGIPEQEDTQGMGRITSESLVKIDRSYQKRDINVDETVEIINPVYTYTRIIDYVPSALEKNRIVSHLKENRLTNKIKILQTQILNKLEETNGTSFMVTSSNSSEGKTFIAINLAISISQQLDKTVLLVDANLKSPSIDKFFGFDEEIGLTDYLLYKAEIPDLLLNPGIQKLVILPAGKPVDNSTELLNSPRMDSFVKEIRKRYSNRLIIFDTSSLLSNADSLVCADFTDGILFVVESERTSISELRRATGLIKDKKVIGTILNKKRD